MERKNIGNFAERAKKLQSGVLSARLASAINSQRSLSGSLYRQRADAV